MAGWRRHLGLFWGLMAVMGAMLMAVPAHAAPGWQPNEDDQLLLDVRVKQYRLGNGARGYRTDRGVCVDLADTVMALDLPVRIDRKSRRATGWLLEERRTFTLDRDANLVQIMNKGVPIAGSAIHDTPEGWCVDTAVLSDWLGIALKPDLSNAMLLIQADRKLPFELAEERKERAAKIRPAGGFDLRTLPQADEPYRMWRTPSVDAVISIAAARDRSLGASRLETRYELYASGEVAKASVDARLSSDSDGVPDSLRLRAYRTDPDGRLLGPLKATHFALGDVATPSTALALQSAVGRGGYITNRPPERPDSFDRTSFRGDLPAGWDVELLRNGELIGYAGDRGDGRYEFVDVALLYGQNRFEIVLHGPQGQLRREQLMVPVGLDSIPPRKTYWWAGGLEAGRDLINLSPDDDAIQRGWRGGIGVERGLNAHTSVSAALVTLMLEGRRISYGEGAVRRAIGPALFEFGAASDFGGGLAWRGQLLGQIGRLNLSAETIWSSGGFQSDRLYRGIDGYHTVSLDHSLKLGQATLPLHVEARYVTRIDGHDTLDAAFRTTVSLRTIALTAELNWTRDRVADGIHPPDRLDASVRASGRIGRVRVRGEARYRLAPDPQFQESNLIAEWRAGERADWRAELGYDATLRRGRAAMGYVRRFDRFALSGSAEIASDGSLAAGLDLVFSIGPDARGEKGGMRFSERRLAASGQAMVTVFRDLNGDGVRQAGEPTEPDVDLAAGMGFATRTDRHGRAIIDGLEPFRPVLIGIDAGSLADPFLQPSGAGMVLTPRPGIATAIDLPLVASGSVEGTLQRDGGAPLSGVALELIDVRGQVLKTARTEYDGYFLFEGVPYGRYVLRIAAPSAAAARLQTALAVKAEVSGTSPSASLGTVVAQGAVTVAGVP